MAEVRIEPQKILKSGITPSYTGSLLTANTYLVRNNGRIALHFKKSGAGACDVTIQTPVQMAGLDVAENIVNVPATTGDKLIGPFPTTVFNDGLGDLRFTLSEITGLTVAALEL